jgi:hypothetical protein
MTGQEMRTLIRTGTCPNCRGALSDRAQGRAATQAVGDCAPCGITWFSVLAGPDLGPWPNADSPHMRGPMAYQVEGYPIGERYTGYA